MISRNFLIFFFAKCILISRIFLMIFAKCILISRFFYFDFCKMYFNFTKFFKAHNLLSNGPRMVPILIPRMVILPSTLLVTCIIWLSKRLKPKMLQPTKLSSLIVQAKRKFKFPLSFIVSNWNNLGFIFFCLKTSHVIDMHSQIYLYLLIGK